MRRESLVLLLCLLACACAPAAKAVPIRGPDGSQMLHVSCGSDESRCYALAGEHCPTGYDLARTGAAAGNFLVRCRTASVPLPQSGPTAALPFYAPMSPAPAPVTTAPGYPPLGSGRPYDPNDVGY